MPSCLQQFGTVVHMPLQSGALFVFMHVSVNDFNFHSSVIRCAVTLSLHDGSPLGDSSPSHYACAILRHCRQRSRACVTTTDPFSIMEKSDESQFFENMTIYLKTKKMSQWTKQMRWRIKKSLPSFVSYVDVEPYAVSRLQHN